MAVRVIVPPEPIAGMDDFPPHCAADDWRLQALVRAVTGTIDGPSGWLGRALGAQTLEATFDCWGDRFFRLFCRPIIEIVSVTYLDGAGTAQTVAGIDYTLTGDLLWLKPSWSRPSVGWFPEPIKVRYRAGYDGVSVNEGGTGPVPQQAKEFVVMTALDMLRIGLTVPGLRSETIEGIGSQTYLDSDKISGLVRTAAENLLQGLRVYSA